MRVGIDARKIADFGIGTYIRGLLRGLVELQSGDSYVAFAPAGAPIPEGIEHAIVDAPHYSVRELIAVGRAADRARLDLFHAPHYVVPFTRVPVVVTVHDLIHLHQPLRNPLAKIYARTMLRRAVKKARCVLTVTEAVRGQVMRELGATNVFVTPNGATTARAGSSEFLGVPRVPRAPASALPRNSEEPRNCEEPEELRGTISFLYVGNDKPHKNVSALVAAFARVRREIPDARLVMAGGDFSRFEDVDARGFVDDDELSALYASAIALVMPSLEEGFGLPALEAMAHRTAVITSRDAALVEITGDAALHVDARDEVALSEAMLRVARDPQLRASLATNGAKRARDFTWRRCAEATRAAYEVAFRRGTSWNNP